MILPHCTTIFSAYRSLSLYPEYSEHYITPSPPLPIPLLIIYIMLYLPILFPAVQRQLFTFHSSLFTYYPSTNQHTRPKHYNHF